MLWLVNLGCDTKIIRLNLRPCKCDQADSPYYEREEERSSPVWNFSKLQTINRGWILIYAIYLIRTVRWKKLCNSVINI